MDDFYLIFRTKKEAQEMLAIIREYMDGVELELNQKTGIFPLKNGIDFLGFHTYLTEEGGVVQKLRRDSIKRIRSKIRHWREDYAAGTITKEKIIEKFVAWDAHAAHGGHLFPPGQICQAGQRDCRRDYKARRKINGPDAVRTLRKVRQAQELYRKTHKATEDSVASFSAQRPDDIAHGSKNLQLSKEETHYGNGLL